MTALLFQGSALRRLVVAQLVETVTACPACGHVPTTHAGHYLAEACRCTDADRLDADIRRGAFMAPEVKR